MRFKYRHVDIRSLKGMRLAERLQRNGWKIISVGFDTILFEKPIMKRRK